MSQITNLITGSPSKALSPLQNFQPSGFNAPGLTGRSDDGTFTLTRTPAMTAALAGSTRAFANRSQAFGNLLPSVRPLASDIREAGLARLTSSRQRAIGNLRENLSRRKVLGSSFASDALARAEAEYGLQEAQFEADVGMQELSATLQIIDQQTMANVQSFQTQLQQFNLENEIAAGITNNVNQIMGENARMMSEVLTDFAGARAEIIGTAIGAGATFGAASMTSSSLNRLSSALGG